MAETHDFGALYVQRLNLDRTARIVQRGKSTEISPPFRTARPVVFRVPLTGIGIVVGVWKSTAWDEETALYEAVSGWGLDPYDDSFQQAETKAIIRKNVADSGLDIDDEWRIVSALGADQ